WVEQGFSAAIREAPPGTARADRLATSIRSDGKLIEVKVSSEKGDLMNRLAGLLAEVESLRLASEGTTAGKGAEFSAKLRAQLIDPVAGALKAGNVPPHAVSALNTALQKGLAALTYGDISSIEVTAS